ncbi:uncharacterized protein LOC119379180 [Rhipicephalus sanguineus]|uniref:uncharacterized protein LOC119379180 n=1 Tax=Rhipicephalus sanguineus TaxID=34632 RepID=UPI0020C3758B|nr:uncharacterized protein LOC119379180 [Rhipicephalus sanguineus]
MKPRKRYLDPGGGVTDLPYTTRKRLAENKAVLQQATVQDAACSVISSETSSPRHAYLGSDEDAVPSPSPPHESDAGDATLQPEPAQGEEPQLTPDDLLALAVNFAIQYALPWKGVEALQRLLAYVLRRSDVPVTKFLFRKNAGISIDAAKFHFYCINCKSLVSETSGRLAERNNTRGNCSVCSKSYSGKEMLRDGHFYVSLPLRQQLASILSTQEVAVALRDRLNEIDDCSSRSEGDEMGDITDGKGYLAMRQKLKKNDLSLTFNSDGSPLFKSSKYAIWPVQVIINELAPHHRNRRVVTTTLWYGQSHPQMELLMGSFVQELEHLAQNGITWTDGTSSVTSQVYLFSCCADAPARAIMQNMRQFNGYFGCGWCLHPGSIVDGTIKYTMGEPVPDRTAEETTDDMETAANTGTVVQGIKGPTPLINMPHFDIIWGFIPDYMHCVLLGVMRQLTELWLSGVGKPYYIGRPALFTVVDTRLCSIKPPLCFRLQRSLSLRKYWKAVEWQQWLLWFSVPCLHGILPTDYFKHFTLLVKGVSLLLMDSVSSMDVSESASLLAKFVVGVQFLYGEKEMTFNVHQLLHLPKSVTLQGPLWSHSCFVFESNIGHVKELVTSAKGVPIQIVERLLMASAFASLKALTSPQTKEFLVQRQ